MIKNIKDLNVGDFVYSRKFNVFKINDIIKDGNKVIIDGDIYRNKDTTFNIDDEGNFIYEDSYDELYIFTPYIEKIINGTWEDNKEDEEIITENIVYEYEWHETIYNKQGDEIIRFYGRDSECKINTKTKEVELGG